MTTSVDCPVCGKRVPWTRDSRWRPFCSDRCRTIDLGDWAADRLGADALELARMLKALALALTARKEEFYRVSSWTGATKTDHWIEIPLFSFNEVDYGVQVHLNRNTVQITDGATGYHRMVFADGTWLETDMIVFSAGIRPRDELARQSLLALGARGGIAIDDHCRSSDPDVYAIGECASWNEQTFGLVAPGYDMARVAARHLAGEAGAAFAGADMSTKLKLMGVDVASIGDAHGKTARSRNYQYVDERKQVYKKIVVSEDGQFLLEIDPNTLRGTVQRSEAAVEGARAAGDKGAARFDDLFHVPFGRHLGPDRQEIDDHVGLGLAQDADDIGGGARRGTTSARSACPATGRRAASRSRPCASNWPCGPSWAPALSWSMRTRPGRWSPRCTPTLYCCLRPRQIQWPTPCTVRDSRSRRT